MFGLTFEKLLLVGTLAALLIGPDRLPQFASTLARMVKGLKQFADGAKSRMRDEMGPEFDEVDWKKLDPRQYDPRRIIREALADEPGQPAPSRPVLSKPPRAAGGVGPNPAGAPAVFDSEAT